MTPMPPFCAMAIAMLASPTVSMDEAAIGRLSWMLRVMRERISTSDGITSDKPGFNSTSSKVYASGKRSFEIAAIANSAGPAVEPAYKCDAGRTAESGLVRRLASGLFGPHLGWRRSIARLGWNE